MKAEELRGKEIEDLERSEHELYDQYFKLRFQQATNQIENPGKIRLVRKDLARVKTVLGEKRRGQAPTEASQQPGSET